MAWPDAVNRAYSLILDKLTTWLETAIKLLPNAIVAVLVFLLFYGLGRLLRSGVRRGLGSTRVPKAIGQLVGRAVYFALVAFGLFVALSILNLDKAVTSLLAGIGIVGLALSFAFQDLATNFISGLILLVQRPLKSGDLVDTNGFVGVVQSVGLRSIALRDLDGQHVVIPSKDVFQSPLLNFSTDAERRISLDVGVSYGEDLDRVEAVVLDAVRGMDFVLPGYPIKVHWHGFGSSSIDFTLRFWIGRSDEAAYNDAQSSALKAIKRAFDAHDIVIPFPIRTLDFGIKGGRTAEEVMSAIDAERRAS